MGDRSAIEWTNSSWTPIVARRRDTGKVGFHCEHDSEGCRNCYSETFNRRGLPARGTGLAYKPGHRADVEIMLDEKTLLQPLHWRRPRMIFVCSMTDLFADFVTDEMIDRVFAVMALCPQHTFQLLTKRPERMRDYVGKRAGDWVLRLSAAVDVAGLQKWADASGRAMPRWPLPNIWLGCSVEDQPTADARIPHLLATPAAVRFVSAEPLLAPIDFTRLRCPNLCEPPWYCNRCHPDGGAATGTFDALGGGEIDQIIIGGESGPHARPMHLPQARAILAQCAASGVAGFLKQLGRRAIMDRVDAVQAVAQGAAWRAESPGSSFGEVTFRDRKGGDLAEWPADVRVRDMPEPRP